MIQSRDIIRDSNPHLILFLFDVEDEFGAFGDPKVRDGRAAVGAHAVFQSGELIGVGYFLVPNAGVEPEVQRELCDQVDHSVGEFRLALKNWPLHPGEIVKMRL